MEPVCLKIVLCIALIFQVAIAIDTNVNCGNFEDISSDEHVSVTIIEPTHYKLLLKLYTGSKVYFGESNITVRIHEEITKLRLQCCGPYINTSSIVLHTTWTINQVVSHVEYNPSAYSFDPTTQIFEIIFYKPIIPGLYTLHMQFRNLLEANNNIINHQYLINVGTPGTLKRRNVVLGILSKPNRTRRIFPCWDEPKIKMDYEISIIHFEQDTVISNMPVKMQLPQKNNQLLTHFHVYKDIASYQVAIVVFQNMVHDKIDDMYLWHHTGTSYKYVLWNFWNIKNSLNIYFEIYDKLKQTDHIVIPDFPYQVMAHSEFVIYREQSFKYETYRDFSGRELDIYKRLSNELARQLLVETTHPFSWSDFWLIEAVASFLSHFIIVQDQVHRPFMNLSIVQTTQGALYYDVNFQMVPVSYNYDRTDEIDAIHYSRLYYNKGATLMRMLYNLVTPEDFNEGICKYVKNRENVSSSIKDVWPIKKSVLSREKKYDLMKIMDTWMTQRNFPEVKVLRDHETNSAILLVDNCYGVEWMIPITYVIYKSILSSSKFNLIYNISENIFFQCQNHIVLHEIENSTFIIVNVEQKGYYRVNYDSNNWQRISTFLLYYDYTQIHVVNRAQLIDDAYYFAMKGEFEISEFLHLIKYLNRETHFAAWYPMFNILFYMSKYFELSESLYVKSHMLEILNSLLTNIGYEERNEDDDMIKSLRLLATKWACKFGHTECIAVATAKLITHLADPVMHPIPPWWKEWVYCAGVMRADLNWYKLLNKYLSIFTQERLTQESLTYIACSENEHMLITYLEMLWEIKQEELMISIDRASDPEEAYDIVTTIYRFFVKKHARKSAILMHILNNYDRLSILGSISSVPVIGHTIMELYSKDNFEKIAIFLKSDSNVTEGDKSKIESFVTQRKKQLDKISYNFRVFLNG